MHRSLFGTVQYSAVCTGSAQCMYSTCMHPKVTSFIIEEWVEEEEGRKKESRKERERERGMVPCLACAVVTQKERERERATAE